jgi:Ca-activated chloride channel family protein
LEKKKNNVFLSVIGMGCNNYKDDKLEILAKNGNGNYCVINEEFGIKENIINRYEQFMVTIAKDVKAQVEFNPSKVKSYRLLGYENRELAHSDFSNDGVISEPFGSGSTCVALYEIEPANEKKFVSILKYQKSTLTESDEYCTVSVRYKLPLEETSQVISKSINNCGDFSENLKLAFICYAIGEMYRQSKFDDLKDKLMAKYLAETFENSEKELTLLNGQKIELLKFLMS